MKVFAQQFAWRFVYPGNVRSDELVMPLHRHVKFDMTSADVIHSFWIPQMGQKQDVVPGIQTKIVVTPTRPGTYTLICTELCGLGHATMRAPVRVLEEGAFSAWLATAGAGAGRAAAGGAGGATTETRAARRRARRSGRSAKDVRVGRLRRVPRLQEAGTDAQVGPALDDLAAAAQKAGESVPDYVRQSIEDPNAVVVAGYRPASCRRPEEGLSSRRSTRSSRTWAGRRPSDQHHSQYRRITAPATGTRPGGAAT